MSSLIAYPNRTDESTLSGGSWQASLPLANLQDRTISHVARTTDATAASTRFDLQLAKMRLIRVFGIINHNLSSAATYRIRASGEAAATNVLLYSEQFDNAAWTAASGVVVTANALTAPDGNTTADMVDFTGAANSTGISQAVTVANDLVSRIGSVFVKAGTCTQFQVSLIYANGTPVENDATVDLGAGTVSGTAVTLAALAGGWYRISSYALNNGSGNTSCALAIRRLTSGGTVYVWGAQLETGNVATSYYPSTSAASVRPAGYMDAWQSYSYDSGVTAVWPIVYPNGVLEWEADNFWSGQTLDEDKVGYNLTLINVLPNAVFAQYYRFEFFDSTNPASYIQLGRLFLASEWVPAENMELSASIAYETKTVVDEAISGTEYFDERMKYRVQKFSLNLMTEDEGFTRAFDLMGAVGISKEVLFMWDTKDTVHRLRRSFMGRLRTLSALEMPYDTFTKTSYEIKELL